MKKYYWIVYIGLILIIVLSLVVFPSMSDMLEMLLYATAIFLTSVFLYSTRKRK